MSLAATKSMDLGLINRLPPSSPKEMRVINISADTASEYNELWHSLLPLTVKSNLLRNKHKAFYAAEFLNNCYAVAIWTSPIATFSNDFVWLELRRMAIAPDAPKFTATWMLAKMIKDIKKTIPDVNKLVSYQDTSKHSGTIYAAGNWRIESRCKFKSWGTEKRKRNNDQSQSEKIRWVYDISRD